MGHKYKYSYTSTMQNVRAISFIYFLKINVINKVVVQTRNTVQQQKSILMQPTRHQIYISRHIILTLSLRYKSFYSFDCDVCQIIHLPVYLHYRFIFTLTVVRIKTQGLNISPCRADILHQMCNR